MDVKTVCKAALFMAVIFVVTRFIQIPIPLGYLNIGNSIILLSCILMPMPYGIAASALGSALADLTSFPIYTIPTLIIKAIMPLLFYLIIGKKEKSTVRIIVAFIIATIIPLVGYTATGMFLYGGFEAGMAQLPGLVVEFVLNIVIFCALFKPVKKLSVKL